MNIYEKIQKAKELILEANLKKSGKNSFAGYTYYELADILPTIIKVCNELKLFTLVNFTEEYATLDIINIEEPKEMVQYSSPMKELSLKGANAIQALGGVQTYQRRYLYMSAFDIIENDMFDGSPPVKDEPKPPSDEPVKKATLEKMHKGFEMYATKVKKDVASVKASIFAKMKIKDEASLTEAQALEIIARVVKQLER